MEKDFDNWDRKKKVINEETPALFYHQREIWWCSLGINVGFEIDGTGDNFDRPILVLKGFNKNTFLGLALTGRKKEGKYFLSWRNRESSGKCRTFASSFSRHQEIS